MKNFLKRIAITFATDFRTIILAVLLAVIVWFAISLQIFPDIISHVDNIPIITAATDYMTEHNLKISDDFEKSATVQISGKRYVIGNLVSGDFFATADLSSIKEAGVFPVKVDVKTVNDIDCQILTENLIVEVKIEKTVRKTFSVGNGDLYATAADVEAVEGFKIDSIVADPQQITITGDEKIINTIDKVEIKAIYSGKADTSIQSKGEVVLYSGDKIMQNPDVTFDNDTFNVSVILYKQKTLPLSIQFTNVPANFDLSSLKYSIYPSEITIASPDASIDDMDKFDVGAIDLSQLTTKYLQKLTLPISLPAGYKNVSGNTNALITFETDNYISLDFTIPKDNIIVSNAPDTFDITAITNELTVSVVGPSKDLLEMTSSDIYATANLLGTNISESTKDISVTFRIKGTKTNCWVTGEYKITVQVSPKSTDETDEFP